MIFFAVLFEAAEVEHVVDESGQAFAFADDGVQVVLGFFGVCHAAIAEQIGIHANGGERGF